MRIGIETSVATAIALGAAGTESPFGANLFDGFEWALVESGGSVINVANESQFLAALSNSDAIIDLGGNTITLSAQVELPNNTTGITTIRNGTLTGQRIYKGNTSKWRFRNLEVANGAPDCVKPDGGFLDLDGCNIHGADDQGVLVHADSIVIRNCLIHNNGNFANQDHGIYMAEGTGALIFNSVLYNNQAYQAQLYPKYQSILMVCCTMYGGVTRGGVVIGSDNIAPVTSDVLLIGCIAAHSQTFGYEQFQTVGTVEVADCVAFDCVSGGFDTGTWTVTRPVNGDPDFVNPSTQDFHIQAASVAIDTIDPSFYNLVPPTDIDGTPRVTADAGAYAFV